MKSSKKSYLQELVWRPSCELDNCPDWLNCGLTDRELGCRLRWIQGNIY